MIELVAYDATWPLRFERKADLLRNACGTEALRVDHVGSTSVPGMRATPVIDVQITVASLA